MMKNEEGLKVCLSALFNWFFGLLGGTSLRVLFLMDPGLSLYGIPLLVPMAVALAVFVSLGVVIDCLMFAGVERKKFKFFVDTVTFLIPVSWLFF